MQVWRRSKCVVCSTWIQRDYQTDHDHPGTCLGCVATTRIKLRAPWLLAERTDATKKLLGDLRIRANATRAPRQAPSDS